jgi:hypothetical protein
MNIRLTQDACDKYLQPSEPILFQSKSNDWYISKFFANWAT